MQLRDVMWHVYRRNACDATLAAYNTQHNKCAHMQRKAGICFETNLAHKAASYPKKMFFWASAARPKASKPDCHSKAHP